MDSISEKKIKDLNEKIKKCKNNSDRIAILKQIEEIKESSKVELKKEIKVVKDVPCRADHVKGSKVSRMNVPASDNSYIVEI